MLHYLPTCSIIADTCIYLPTQATICQHRQLLADKNLFCRHVPNVPMFATLLNVSFFLSGTPTFGAPSRSASLAPRPLFLPAHKPARNEKWYTICRQTVHYLQTWYTICRQKIQYLPTWYTICQQRLIICRHGIQFADKGLLFADKVIYLPTKYTICRQRSIFCRYWIKVCQFRTK